VLIFIDEFIEGDEFFSFDTNFFGM